MPSKWRKWVLIERDIQASLRGMRGETSTWIENACCPNNFTEYYDLQRDPYQIDNRSRDLSSADRKALSSFLGRLQACAGPTCRSIEDEDLTVVLPKGGTSH